MATKRPPLINGEIYHIVIRAVEGSKLFRDKKDYLRIIHDLFEFNDENPVGSNFRMGYLRKDVTSSDFVTLKKKRRKLLVEILAFCLMTNHVHLLVRQLQEGGISKFMQKLGGYGLYYNYRYKRVGHVFQGKYRIVRITTDKQLITIFVYIHANPVAIIIPGWKEKGIKNFKKVIKFLEDYEWSSYPDYLRKGFFPSLTAREFLLETMGGSKGCRDTVNNWLKQKRSLTDFEQVALE